MDRRITLLAAVAAMSFGITAAAESNPVAASFERMLQHEPVSSLPAAPPADAEPLQQAVNGRLHTLLAAEAARGRPAVAALAQDDVAAAFERMLAHRPGAAAAAVPAGFEADPLVAVVVEPLRVQVAGHALPAAYAHLKHDAGR